MIKWWHKLEKAAGVRRVTGHGWHSLRRKLVNDGRRAGVDDSVIAEIGGWNGTKTLTEYRQPDKKLGRAAIDAIAHLRVPA